jgi:hypothetical protein
VSGGDTSEHGPPPPPPPPSGSPFGRFLTAPVLMGAALAIVVSFVALRFVPGENGGGATAPVPSGIEGSWEGPGVRLEVTRTGGTLTERDCRGVLMPRAAEGVFDYTETSGRRGCPRRRVVTLSLLDRDTLRVDERGDARDVVPTTLTRAG